VSGARVVLLGSRSTASVTAFRVLQELGCELPLVISGDEDPGVDDWRLSLVKAARDAGYKYDQGLAVVHDPHTPQMLARIKAAAPDVLLSVQWRRILKPSLIELASRYVVNLHNAPLPMLRGCDPFSWAIHDGLEVMGVSLHVVPDTGVDSGPVLAQRLWPVRKNSTAWSLYEESLPEAERLMREFLPGTLAGTLPAVPQDSSRSSYHPLGQFKFGELEARWEQPSLVVSSALRSRVFPPFQLPYFLTRGRKVEIMECEATAGRGKAGTVLATDSLRIATRPGALQITRARIDGTVLEGARIAAAAGLSIDDVIAQTS
jgi:methionyl-tRNA formyltransferase